MKKLLLTICLFFALTANAFAIITVCNSSTATQINPSAGVYNTLSMQNATSTSTIYCDTNANVSSSSFTYILTYGSVVFITSDSSVWYCISASGNASIAWRVK